MGRIQRSKNIQRKWWLIFAAFLLILGTGALVEFLYNLPFQKENDYRYFEESQIEADGFILQDGVYVSQKGGASLTLHFDEQFVDKLYYRYDFDGQLNATIYVGDYQLENSSKDRKIQDANNATLRASTVNIHKKTDTIKIVMDKDAEHVNILAAAINNTGNYSAGRFMFSCLAMAFALFLLCLWKARGTVKPEWVFLVVSVTVGILMIYTTPARKTGMDEEIHFGRAYYLFDMLAGKKEVTVTSAMNDLITVSLPNWPETPAASEEEMQEDDAYWNALLAYNSQKEDSPSLKQPNYSFHLYSLCYLNQAVMLKLGELLRLDFTDIYRLGRMGNLILYCLVIFFAIRKIPFGKRIMLVLALSPLGMFSAVSYTYDTTVTAFTFLGIAFLLPELMDDGGKLTEKNAVMILVSFVIASLPKPVYIPMLLTALWIPGTRFSTPKKARAFRAAVAAVFLAMLATFALEPIFNANQAGDARGGDTGVGRQLRYIFAHPIRYTTLLLSSMGKKFFSFTFGYQALGRMGHLPGNRYMTAPAMLLVGTLLTDRREEQKKDLKTVQRVAALVCCFMVISLIFTAMYLSFTPVGADIIRGVQGRYYLPVTMLALLAVRPNQIFSRLTPQKDLAAVSAASISILMVCVYHALILAAF